MRGSTYREMRKRKGGEVLRKKSSLRLREERARERECGVMRGSRIRGYI